MAESRKDSSATSQKGSGSQRGAASQSRQKEIDEKKKQMLINASLVSEINADEFFSMGETAGKQNKDEAETSLRSTSPPKRELRESTRSSTVKTGKKRNIKEVSGAPQPPQDNRRLKTESLDQPAKQQKSRFLVNKNNSVANHSVNLSVNNVSMASIKPPDPMNTSMQVDLGGQWPEYGDSVRILGKSSKNKTIYHKQIVNQEEPVTKLQSLVKAKLEEAKQQPADVSYCIAVCKFKLPKTHGVAATVADLVSVKLPNDKKLEAKLNKLKPKIMIMNSSKAD